MSLKEKTSQRGWIEPASVTWISMYYVKAITCRSRHTSTETKVDSSVVQTAAGDKAISLGANNQRLCAHTTPGSLETNWGIW